ncbi:MAG: caspase family protein [Candidatus Tectimicrobiota bacterium]
MPAPFHRLTLREFARVLDEFPFTRRIDAVHMHHTWRPNHSQYKGHDSIAAMWRFHTQHHGWSDIAQHLTIAPDGTLWTGRNWNQAPASAAGHNGNRTAGPFMFEMIGDFDHGRDRFEGEQRRVTLAVIALVQQKFHLAPETLRFHNQMSSKSCPGSSLSYPDIVEAVRALQASGEGEAWLGTRDPGEEPFRRDMIATQPAIAALSRSLPLRDDPAEAEPEDDAMGHAQVRALFEGAQTAPPHRDLSRTGSRATPLGPEMLNALRPHVINLHLGQFSTDGHYSTTPGDVDAIFDDYLERELEGARARKAPLRLLFYAHGGLVKESLGLQIAARHVSWWQKNQVYPIHFVWETGLFETIGQLLRRAWQGVRGVTRDIFDYTTDPIVEELVRALYGPQIWSGMQRSAELAVGADGGAFYVAQKLKAFCDRHQQDGPIELHAVGHSAGSIFHAHFIPTACDLGVPSFHTVQFLAPAVRTETFLRQLAPRLGHGIESLALFTMSDSWERADTCAQIYRKSLLYLVYRALERDPKTPLLGLEICLRNDARLRALFGLGNTRGARGEVIWSPTLLETGRNASLAVEHGGFDDDPATMNSVARRVLGADDNDPIQDFPRDSTGRGSLSLWDEQVDWPADMGWLFASGGPSPMPEPTTTGIQPPAVVPVMPLTPAGSSSAPAGRRRALCVGINQYPTAPLYGCVADAETWQATLRHLGFSEIAVLRDQQATRSAILAALTDLVTTSRAGDVVVFQFAGHGTQLPDMGSDEAEGDTPGQDEALCPIDFASGAFVIDDDIGAIFTQIPPGVNLTCFIDCCHSGTISRFGVGVPSADGAGSQGLRPRFIQATPQMSAAHQQFRQQQGRQRAVGSRGMSEMKEVLFAACLSSEVAYENNGHGDFTTRATRVLQAGLGGMTNEQFETQVMTAFGSGARQHPRLYCHPEAKTHGLLQPLGAGGRSLAPPAASNGSVDKTAQLLRLLAAVVEGQG